VKEALHAALHDTGFESLALEIIHDLIVNVVSAGAVSNASKCDLLTLLDTVVSLFQSIRCTATDNRSRDIAVVSGFLRTGKKIHDNRCMRANRAAALIMRIHALIS